MLARCRQEQPGRWDLADDAAEALLANLVRGLSVDPARRPDLATFRRALPEARAVVDAPRA